MVKAKQPNLVTANTKRKRSSSGDADTDSDWVIVKKQRINIIIPPPSPVLDEVETEPINPLMHSPCQKERSDSSIPKTIRVDDSGGGAGDGSGGGLKLYEYVAEDQFGAINRRLPVCADRNGILERRIRTMLIERRLKQVGGLSAWLVSLGLARFVKIFECNGFGKYRLGCLTMGELKEMGAFAVGPRRKLLHAIDRLCQPYFEGSL